MDELVKKGFELLDRYWHKKPTALLAPLIIFIAVLWLFYSPGSNKLSVTGLFSSGVAALIALAVWIFTNRLPRVSKGNVGIVVGILCDDPDEHKQVKIDFIANLRQLIEQDGEQFQLIELPSWALEGIENQATMSQLLHKVRGHFLLYGRVRLRNKDGKPAHILAFEGIVRHRVVPDAVSRDLSDDFTKILPRRLIIEKENDAFKFESTSEWTDVSARYVIGIAALISGDVAYAEKLFLYVENKLQRSKLSVDGIKEISRRLPQRFRQLYAAWQAGLYSAYFSSRDERWLTKYDEICAKHLKRDPASHHAMMGLAMCEFVLRKDVSAAHALVTQARDEANATWLYSRAFLHAYQGKMVEAVKDYKNAFKGPIPDQSVPVQCEEFIQIALRKEPDKVQFHFCLGLINYHAKSDYEIAAKDFREFLSKLKDGEFRSQKKLAQELLAVCEAKILSKESKGA